MHRLIVLNGSLKQVKVEPFDYEEGKSLARYLEEGWAVAQQLTWGDNLVLLLEKDPRYKCYLFPRTRTAVGQMNQLKSGKLLQVSFPKEHRDG